jgi:predicted amidophosphoribosyltransferase
VSAVRFQNIDDQNRDDHYYLTAEDDCLFLYEYTARMGYAHSETNQLISNLKKKRGAGGYHWKADAIKKCSAAIGPGLNQKWLKDAVLIPVPPSKIKTDPNYDDRMVQVCRGVTPTPDFREIVYQISSTPAAHETDDRPSPDEIAANYAINEALCQNMPRYIGVVDDVLTAGAHFKAMQKVLGARFPNRKVVGLFIARRIFASPFKPLSIEELLK